MSKLLLHYAPEDGWFGDPMPLYHEGAYHIFYTKRRLDDRLCWGHVATRDFVSAEAYPDPLEPGAPGSLDEVLFTGCAVAEAGRFVLFYAGGDAQGQCRMLRAISQDGIHFVKEYRELFAVNAQWYRPDGTWRDPQVFWNEAERQWWMVFCARRPELLPDPYPGILGLAVSDDLEHWILRPPIDVGHVAGSLECPDVFPIDGRWGLVYYWHDTRIRFADAPSGPWARRCVESPNHFDFMAAKRTFDGQRHVLIGWVPRRDCDCAERTWGGHMAWPRELYLDADGQPACRFLPELADVFTHPRPRLSLKCGVCGCGGIRPVDSGLMLADAQIFWPSVPDDFRLRCSLRPEGECATLTLLLRCGRAQGRDPHEDVLNEGYQLIFDWAGGLLRLREHYQWDQRPDITAIPLTRDAEARVDMILYDDILEVCLNERESLVSRLLKHPDGALALCVQDGCACVRGWRIDATCAELADEN